MTKQIARKECLIVRNQFNNNRARSNRVIKQIVDSHILDNMKYVGIYYPIKNEINVLGLVAKYPNITFCIPKTKEEISFYPLGEDIVVGKYGIIEPANEELISREKIEAFIIPSVGINKEKRRLGYGKGYYDRYLTGYNGVKIGVQYKELCELDFESFDYDLELDYIFKGWSYVFSSTSYGWQGFKNECKNQ